MARITRREEDELRKLVKSYNAKIRRASAKGVDEVFLPSPVTLTELRTMSRSGINQFKANARAYTQPKIKWTEDDASRLKQAQEIANTHREQIMKQFNDLKYRIISEEMRGVVPTIDRTVLQDRFPTAEEQRVFSRDISTFTTREELEDYISSTLASTDERWDTGFNLMQLNFVDSLDTVFGEDMADFARLVQNMPLEDFLRLYYTTDVFNFGFLYGVDDYDTKLAQTRYVLNDYFGQGDMEDGA